MSSLVPKDIKDASDAEMMIEIAGLFCCNVGWWGVYR